MRTTACLPFLLLFAACGTAHDWREVPVGPMVYGQVYDGIDAVARGDGYLPSIPDSDRGLGIYQTRWRHKNLAMGRPGRFRLRAEIMEGGSREQGWTVRFYIEAQKVKDLGKSLDHTEDDWSGDGQDGEREGVFGERLRRYLVPLAEKPAAPQPGAGEAPKG